MTVKTIFWGQPGKTNLVKPGECIVAPKRGGPPPLAPPIFDGVIPDINATVGVPITPYDASVHFQTGGAVDSWILGGETNGITIDNAGIISGTPLAATTNNFFVRADNADGSDDSNQFQLIAEEAAVSVTAKSVVFDLADNWGHGTLLGVRSVEFLLNSVLIPMPVSAFTASATTEVAGTHAAPNAFNTDLSKLGSDSGNCWAGSGTTNQRLIIVFNAEQAFDEIVINNYHSTGVQTNVGANNAVITISDDAITDTTYDAPVANSTVLEPAAVFLEHALTDTEDPQTVWTF